MPAVRVLDIDAASYQRHLLHEPDMPWQETNCYLDIWIEVIHAFGFEVAPCLGSALAVDFEEDQWTFFKPSFQDLQRLYGFKVEELTLWRPLPDQCATQIGRGNVPLLEVDSFYLPDTEATDYRRHHVKTTIGINEIDVTARRLGYFHNAGYHQLGDTDYDGLFRLDRGTPDDYLPPYCEFVKTSTLRSANPPVELVIELLREQFASRPDRNPFDRYAEAFAEHLNWVTDMDAYHAYVFVTLRQCGAAFDMAASHFRWIAGATESGAASAWEAGAEEFSAISATCKTLLLKLARVAAGKSPSGLTPLLSEMSAAWDRGMVATGDALASRQ